MCAFESIQAGINRSTKSLRQRKRSRGRRTSGRRLRSEKLEPRQMMTGSTVDGFYGVMVTGDFNDDGFDDVAHGLADQTINGNERAGAVSIHYGSANGLISSNGLLHQDSPGIGGFAEEGDRFGTALSVGDFDGDGFDDLAIGVPTENYYGPNAGAVHILYGGFNGLSGAGSRLLTGIPGERFGTVMETGNFNGDINPSTGLPIDDLAIGMPFADLGVDSGLPNTDLDGNYVNAGAVDIYHGSVNGIGLVRTRSLSQEGSIVGSPEDGDFFGYSLAAGDYNGDGFDELAVGIPGEDLDTDWTPWENSDDAGSVIVVMGSSEGLINDGNYSIDRRNDGAPGKTGEGDDFGFSLMAGDYDGDGFSDLAIASRDDPNGDRAGSVNVHYGNSGTLRKSSPERWYTARSDMPGGFVAGTRFGRYLNVGNFNNNVNPETGLPIDDLLVSGDLHAHHVMPGTPDGVEPTRFLASNVGNTPLDDSSALNPFYSLFFVVSAGDFNGDGQSEIVGFNPLRGDLSDSPVLLTGDIAGRLTVLEMFAPGQLGYGNIYHRTVYGQGGANGVSTGTVFDPTIGGNSGTSAGNGAVMAYTPNGYQEVALDDPTDPTASEPEIISGQSFLNWQRNYGTARGASAADGDLSGDGDVDGADLNLLLNDFGQTLSDSDAHRRDYWQNSNGDLYDLFEMYGTRVIPFDGGTTVPTLPTDPTTTESPSEPTNPTDPTTGTTTETGTGTTTQTQGGSTISNTSGSTTIGSPTTTTTGPTFAPQAAAAAWFAESENTEEEEALDALDLAFASLLSSPFSD